MRFFWSRKIWGEGGREGGREEGKCEARMGPGFRLINLTFSSLHKNYATVF